VQTCLAKDPDDRWQTARDLGRELAWIANTRDEASPKPAASDPRARVPWIAAAVLAAAALAASFAAYRATRPVERPLMRFTDDVGSELMVGAVGPTVAISPDGAQIAYVSRDKGVSHVFVRLLEHAKSTALEGTDGAQAPFFSPDGRWIGFFVGNTVKKVSVSGGAAVTVCSTNGSPRGGGFWGEDGNIYFASARTPIMRVPAGGGTPSAITRLDAQKGEASNRAAQLLPGGDAFLFESTRDNSAWEDATILIQSVKTGERKTLVEGGYFGRYIHGDDPFSGHLIYMHGTTMFAAPMDVRRLALTGPAVPAAEDVVRRPANGVADYGFTASGTVIYLAGAYDATRPLVWFNADGTTEVEPAPANNEYLYPRLSPDGKHIAVHVSNGTTMNLAVYERAEKRLTRLTFTGGIEPTPAIWAPDGRHIVFSLVRGTAGELAEPGLYWTRSDGAAAPQRIVPGTGLSGISVSPDGKRIAYTTLQQPKFGIWTVTLDVTDPDHPRAGSPELFLATEFVTLGAEFSPDGRWLAYTTTESGGPQEVFVRPFPGPGGKFQASVNGGAAVKWIPDRQELMFNDGNTLMVAPYTVNGNSFAVGQSRRWSNATTSLQSFGVGFFDVTRDGKRAVAAMAGLNTAAPLSHVTFLLNFADQLRRNTPTK
jgi:Tol biopolymer transport system component